MLVFKLNETGPPPQATLQAKAVQIDIQVFHFGSQRIGKNEFGAAARGPSEISSSSVPVRTDDIGVQIADRHAPGNIVQNTVKERHSRSATARW